MEKNKVRIGDDWGIIKPPTKLYDLDKGENVEYTKDGQNWMYADSKADHWAPQYSAYYQVYINPKDFLDLTTREGANNLSSYDSFVDLDIDKFNAEKSGMFLEFDYDPDTQTGHVTGHEGRHRMYGLMKRGVKSIPIVLRPDFEDYDRYHPTPINSITLSGQFNPRARVRLTNVKPLDHISWEKFNNQ